MWQGFNQLANAVKEQAEAATRDLGLDSQLVSKRSNNPFMYCHKEACSP